MVCYCESCIAVRERKPETRGVEGHIICASDEGTISSIPLDAPVMARGLKHRRNWLKDSLR